MSISREQVLTVARLARLEVGEQSVQALAADLNKILQYVNKLDELDTTNVEPTSQIIGTRATLRIDEVTPGVAKSLALSSSARSDDRGFLVPGFVDES